jgi:hypothetical protein
MAIESAAELVQFLADELRRRETKPHKFAEITGIAEERLELLQEGAWHLMTLREIAIITECLHIDLSVIWSLLAQEQGNGMDERPSP